jgi:transposase
VHLIAKARIKTDVIDATVLARLYASGFLPQVWAPDQKTAFVARLHGAIRLCVNG